MSTPSPSDRIQVIDYPYALPSKCCVCGSGPEAGRKFVDFGMMLDVYGAVYFCDACVVNMANALGFVKPEMYDIACNQVIELSNENITLEAENREFRLVYSTLRGLGVGISDGNDANSSGPVLSKVESKPEPESVPKPGSKESKANGPSSSKESGRIPSTDGDKPRDAALSF